MLGKQNGVCSTDSKSSGGTSGVTLGSTKHGFTSYNTDSEDSEFPVTNSFLSDRIAPVYNSSLSFPLGELTHTGNSLNLFENTSSTDFLCDELPEIGSFEDVDRLFRRSDSTFGLMDINEDEFGCLSSQCDKGESGDSSQSDFGFPWHETSTRPNASKNHGSSKSYTESSEAPISIKEGSCTQEISDSYSSFLNGLGMCDENYRFIPEEQMNEGKTRLKWLKHMEGKSKEHYFGNGSSSYSGNLRYELNQLSSRTTSHHGHPSADISQQLRPASPNSLFYLQNNDSQSYSDNSLLSDLDSVTFTKSTSLVPWLSSHPSNQMQCMKSSHDLRSFLTAISGTDNGSDIQTYQSNLSSQSSSLVDQVSIPDSGLLGKQVKLCGEKFENPTNTGGESLSIPVEPGSSNVQESSMMKMGVDDTSLAAAAAASFCQLQLVMGWLDLRTKLCIRDGLYRLARGAEHRINNENRYGRSSGGSFMAEETNSCTSFINMETCTNPIDRSIAQLLFHQPSNTSALFTYDV